MKKSFLFFCFSTYTALVFAQISTWEVVTKQEIVGSYQKACNWLIRTPSYSFKIKYTSYKDHVTKQAIESSEGYYKKVSTNYAVQAMGIKTLQNEQMKLMIDTADKTITLMNPSNLRPGITKAEEMEALLNTAKVIKKIRQGRICIYRIEFNKGDLCAAYEFKMNDQGQLEGVTYFYNEQTPTGNEETLNESSTSFRIKPRLEIVLFAYQVPAIFTASEFSGQNIFTRENGKIKLTTTYRDFKLLDYRSDTKQLTH